uniref:Bacterial bifunctional deaminase-reductase C-terminal domain-containing protein n=1 Tax=Chaetoceros debilis TaxID=122233 RepID=A0A7S3Q2R7_9STRA
MKNRSFRSFVVSILLSIVLRHDWYGGLVSASPSPLSVTFKTSRFDRITIKMDEDHPTKEEQATNKDLEGILSNISRWQKNQRDGQRKVENNIFPQSKDPLLERPRPFILVTYAQTIDGMIAVKDPICEKSNGEGKVSANLKLSSSESFLLTHALRSIHDGLLIGGNTLSTDNPRLNNRLWWRTNKEEMSGHGDIDSKSKTGTSKEDMILPQGQPVPIILDTNLRHVMKLIQNQISIKSAASHDYIIICCSEKALKKISISNESNLNTNAANTTTTRTHEEEIQNYCRLHNVRIVLLPCAMNPSGSGLDLKLLLEELYSKCEIKSIMVEGGASILSTFVLSQQAKDCVDCACITICPRIVGRHGLNAMGSMVDGDGRIDQEEHVSSDSMFEFDSPEASWISLGSDCIFISPC